MQQQIIIQVPEDLQKCIIQWISLINTQNFIHYQRPITNLNDIHLSNFYLNILSQIKGFKLSQRLQPQYFQQSLQSFKQVKSITEVINSLKIIQKSILAYYQTCMLIDISQLNFNCVSLAMGDKKQIIKLFLVVLGIVINSKNHSFCFEALQLKMSKTSFINFQQCIQNSKKLSLNEFSLNNKTKNEQSPTNKRLINRLEYLQQDYEFLEEQNKKLKDQINQYKIANKKLDEKILQLKQNLVKSSRRIEDYEQEIESHIRQKNEIQKKYQKLFYQIQQNKIQLNQLKDRQKKQNLNTEQLTLTISTLRSRYNQLKLINQSIKESLQQEKQQKKIITQKNQKLKEKIQNLKNQLNQFKDLKISYQIKIQNLQKQKCNVSPKTNRNKKSFFFLINSEQSDQQENKYRNKQNLTQQLNVNKEDLKQKQRKEKNQKKDYTEIMRKNKNQTNLQYADKFSIENKQQAIKCLGFNQFSDNLQLINSNLKQQIKLLVQIIYELQISQKNRKLYQQQQRQIKLRKTQKFKSKISQMFRKQLLS